MFRKLVSGLTSTAVVAALATVGAVAGSVATAAPAAAASVNIGTVEAQMSGHTGKSGTWTNAQNCIRFDPPLNPPTTAVETTWVTSSTEAATSHGSSGGCPSSLSRSVQSAVGITPTASTTANTNQAFLLGTMRHYNNPINVSESPAKFKGNLNIKFQSTTFTFPYELFETPNSCDDKVDPQQGDCSDDILEFTGTPTGEIMVDGYPFYLVSSGFTSATGNPATCPADPTGTVKTKFITTESTTTTACLYGKLVQKRSITLKKKVVWGSDAAPAAIPDFPFTSTSDLPGSPWKTNPGNLKPANTNGAEAVYGPKDLRASVETVTITEGADPANWNLTDIKCVDGTGQAIGSTSGRTATLKNVPDATSTDALPITCTFTNTYTRSKLTLVKNWGANAVAGDKADLKIVGGVTSPAQVTSTAPTNGTQVATDANWGAGITVSESFPGANTNTYTSTLKCVKTGTTDEVAGSSDGTFDMPKYPVTCTYTNVGKALNPGINVVKSVDKTQIHSGDTVKYTFTVTNTGDSTLSDVKVNDPKCTPVYQSGDTNADNKLQKTETWVYECSKALTETTVNTVVAEGTDPLGKKVTDDDSVTVTVITPGINVVKSVDKTQIHSGDTVKYTFTVTNTGDSTLSDVKVNDPKCTPVYQSGDTNADGKLQKTETWVYECSKALTETTVNTVVAEGTDPLGKKVTDDDSVTVTVITPGINVVKSVDKTQIHSGDTVKYTFTVTNTGDSTLSDVKVNDPKCTPVYQSGDTNADGKLQKTETWVYECSKALTETTVNTVVAEGTDPLGKKVTDDDSVTVTVITPGINVVKKADATEVHAGDKVTYTYTVTNTGDTALSSVKVSDDKCSPVTYKSGDTNADNKLQTDETWVYECSMNLSETTTNVAVVTGTPPVGPPVTDEDTVKVTVLKPGINVVKKADKTEVRVGDKVTYTYTVTNTGDTTLSDVKVTDDKCSPVTYKSGDTNADNKLQTDETWVYECSMNLSETTTNVAVVTGTPPVGPPVTDEDTVKVTVLKPGINVVKKADKTEVKAGDKVTYTYTVTNPGDTTLSDVKVTDDKCSPVDYKSGDTNADNKLQTTETWVFECSMNLSETTTNVAVVTGTPPVGPPVDDEDTIKVTVLKPGINVVKKADKTEVKAGGQVTYTYTVTNTGDSPLLKVKVTDDKCSPVNYKSGDTNENEMLDLEETWIFECTTTLTKTTENTAVATGEDRTGQPVKDEDKVTVTVPKPGIKVAKSADKAEVKAGESVTYTYTVTNTGDIELLNVTVTDDKCAPVVYKSGDTNGDKKLQVNETWTFTCTTVLNEPTTNTALVKGEDRTGQPVENTDKVTVNVTQVSPIVAKTICPIDVTLHKPQPKKVGNKILTDKIKTKKSSCVLLKPVVLCRPLASSAAGETAFCETKVTKKGRITVKTKGYEAVRVSVIVRTKPKPGFSDRWKPDTWRKSWKLK